MLSFCVLDSTLSHLLTLLVVMQMDDNTAFAVYWTLWYGGFAYFQRSRRPSEQSPAVLPPYNPRLATRLRLQPSIADLFVHIGLLRGEVDYQER